MSYTKIYPLIPFFSVALDATTILLGRIFPPPRPPWAVRAQQAGWLYRLDWTGVCGPGQQDADEHNSHWQAMNCIKVMNPSQDSLGRKRRKARAQRLHDNSINRATWREVKEGGGTERCISRWTIMDYSKQASKKREALSANNFRPLVESELNCQRE